MRRNSTNVILCGLATFDAILIVTSILMLRLVKSTYVKKGRIKSVKTQKFCLGIILKWLFYIEAVSKSGEIHSGPSGMYFSRQLMASV